MKDLLQNRIFTQILVFCAAIGIGIAIGWFIHDLRLPQTSQNALSIRENSSEYSFINPLLFVKGTDDQFFPEYESLKRSVESYIDKALTEQKATDVSVYFRNLNTGEWVHIKPDEHFNPASMLKVVTLISILRATESDPGLLQKKVFLKGDDMPFFEMEVEYPATNPIRSGRTYTVNELIEHLIVESDNAANAALTTLVGRDRMLKTYEDLELPPPSTIEEEGGYTSRQYSHLFRALYNGTYLSRKVSEQTLSLLSKTKFKKGIVAGVPEDTTVSHKFGVREMRSGQNILYRELHDCGIVYYPEHPYFVCIMTRGTEFSSLEDVLAEISRLSWENVQKITHK